MDEMTEKKGEASQKISCGAARWLRISWKAVTWREEKG